MYEPTVLDFGPGFFAGWVTSLAAKDVGVNEDSVLNAEASKIVVEGRRVHLSPLELELMRYLVDHKEKSPEPCFFRTCGGTPTPAAAT